MAKRPAHLVHVFLSLSKLLHPHYPLTFPLALLTVFPALWIEFFFDLETSDGSD